jgi:2-C-methyl-D-erythritol 2,4-cyclodiphosphate synthase
MTSKTGIGQDSHAFEQTPGKPLILAGIKLNHPVGLKGNSDADVVLHSITNAISSITGRNILGSVADQLCQEGLTDSSEYLKLALGDLEGWKIKHIAIAIECLIPKISPQIDSMKKNIAKLCHIDKTDIGITATTGEGLTAFGKGEGIQSVTIITVNKS